MRSLLFILAFVFTSVLTYAQSQTWVNGYYKNDGTYIQGHYRQTPNSTNHDNWSTTQQRNPYTLRQMNALELKTILHKPIIMVLDKLFRLDHVVDSII